MILSHKKKIALRSLSLVITAVPLFFIMAMQLLLIPKIITIMPENTCHNYNFGHYRNECSFGYLKHFIAKFEPELNLHFFETMDYIDYYNILGISKNATAEEIKKAYRKLAREHHPDLNPNDKDAEKRFQKINEANEVLSDPEKRKKYDQYGKDWKHAEQFEEAKRQQQASGAYAAGNPFGDGEYYTYNSDEGGDYSDFFASMFGNRGSSGRQTKFKGQDLRASLQIKLSEAYTTHKQTFTVNGKNIRITVPAGIEDGQEIKLAAYGSPGINGGPNGDLYITFEIKNDTAFTRKGNDIYKTVPLNLYKAILGGEETIDTLSGKVKLKIVPETQNGTKVRIKGKGFPEYKKESSFGDIYITWDIQIPTHLTAKEKELFEQLSKER